MYCKQCGNLLGEGDKFCSKCGTPVTEEFVPAFRRDQANAAPQASAAEHRPAAAVPRSAEPQAQPRRAFHLDEISWDLEGYPTTPRKTEDVDFNWSSVLEDRRKAREEASAGVAEDNMFRGPQPEPKSLEEELFSDMERGEEPVSGDPTRISFRRRKDKTEFYTFNKKNAALQAMLDQEYARMQQGDGAAEEQPAAAPQPERQPEEILADLLTADRAAAAGTTDTPEETEVPAETPVAKKAPAAATDRSFVGVTLSSTPSGVVEERPAVEAAEATPKAAPKPGPQAEAAPTETAVQAEAQAQTPPQPEAPEKPEAPRTEVEAAPQQARPEQAVGGEAASLPEEQAAESEAAPEPRRKLTFDDVFGGDDEDEEEEKRPRRKGGLVLRVIAVILCVLVVLELIMIGIQYFAPDSVLAEKIGDMYRAVLQLFGSAA